MDNDGRSLDDKRKEIKENDLQDIIEKYKGRDSINKDKRGKYFLVDRKELEENYDLNFDTYHDDIQEYIKKEDPKKIFKKLNDLENQIQKELKEIENLYE